MATGLLPLCFGEATKFSADLLDADKTYEAELLFGVTTDTGDAEGEVVERRPVGFSADALESAMGRLRGPIEQVPPMYSALKRDGRPLYELARQGVEVERAARAVIIHELTLLDRSSERCRLRVRCSKGTYIRTLAEDLGQALGCGAHLTALRRTSVATLDVGDALTLDALAGMGDDQRMACLQAPDALLQSLPAVLLDGAATARFMHGNPVDVAPGNCVEPGKCRVYGDDRLLGVGEVDASGLLKPRRLVCA